MTARQSLQAFVFTPLRAFLANVLSLADVFLDEVYDRFDLWSVKGVEADYSKVRGFCLYVAVIVVTLIVVLTATAIPIGFLQTVLLAMLAAALGERTLIAFFKAWGARRPSIADAATVDFRAAVETPGKAYEKDAAGDG